MLQQNNGTFIEENNRGYRKRPRRNKSKEINSAENSVIARDNWRKHNEVNNRDSSTEDITQKTTYLFNTLSPLYPRTIIEEHDFSK